MVEQANGIAVNRANWEDKAVAHGRDGTGFYGISAFKAGRDTLFPIEAGEIGDVAGLRILHLQCHIGLDTLSLARRGAHVTGVDFSSNAIAFATNLAREMKIPARFIETDVHDVRKAVPGEFDMVYATWGVLCWIPDVRSWMRVAASMLAPSGRLYLADGHPLVEDAQELRLPDGTTRIILRNGWQDSPIELISEEPYSYTGDAIEHAMTHQWVHSVSEIISGVAEAGLRLMFFHEHDRLGWQRFESMESLGNRLYALPESASGVPLAFSLMAVND